MKHIEVFVLHEYGAENHYRALKYLLDKSNVHIKFYEFSIMKNLSKSILRLDFKLFRKQISNINNLINLFFSKNKKIVFGIAPYDFRLLILSRVLKDHRVFYHTSWPYWDETFFPKKLFFSKLVLNKWEKFLKIDTEHIFVAARFTKSSLVSNKNVHPSKISVVYHSLDDKVFYPKEKHKIQKPIRFLYVGRLTEAKGIKKIIEFFEKNSQNLFLTFVGKGDLQAEVENLANLYENVIYEGYISDKMKLADIYRNSDYLLLPSIKQKNWEELFGMVMIEGMACGLVPVATNHIGPTEVISHEENGILMNEDDFELNLLKLITEYDKKKYFNLRDGAIEKSNDFFIQSIARSWLPILEYKKEQKL